MGSRVSASYSLPITTVAILIFAFSCVRSSNACGISVYWGQNGNEGSLRQACDSGNYTYVNIAFLISFGSGRPPVLNLAGHCNTTYGTCRRFAEEISYCQSLGVKVLLSLGGGGKRQDGTWYNISSTADANNVAKYLWDNFLAGGNPNGFLGDVALNGIDFAIDLPVSGSNWDVLARAIASYSTPQRKIYLAAAPQCLELNLETAIQTGLFDYVWVQFFNNPRCDISSGVSDLLQSWNDWSSSLPAGNQLFMGLPASPAAAGSGYIEPQQLINDILPVIKQSTNYGGIMLWSRFFDTSYSETVSPYVCSGVSETPHIRMVAEN